METHIVGAVRELSRPEAEAILARNHVGRIAFAQGNGVDVEPIHYVWDAGWLYGRTSPGGKLEVLRHRYWVAFEVDEAEHLLSWRSVVVRGGFYTLPADGAAWQRSASEHARTLLQRLLPGSFTPADPTPWRSVLFRIAAQEVVGREAFCPQLPRRGAAAPLLVPA